MNGLGLANGERVERDSGGSEMLAIKCFSEIL